MSSYKDYCALNQLQKKIKKKRENKKDINIKRNISSSKSIV